MDTLKFDLSKKDSNVKIFNATNGGPWATKGWDHDDISKQARTNFLHIKQRVFRTHAITTAVLCLFTAVLFHTT